jgi:hypothetical protein
MTAGLTDYFVELYTDCRIAGFAEFYVRLGKSRLPRRVILERLSLALRTLQ